MNTDSTDSIFDIFIPDCDCKNCSSTSRKPNLFSNVIKMANGAYTIDTASPDHQHLRVEEYASPFDAMRVIRENGLTFVGMF